MKLVKIGNIILNMEQLLAVRDDGVEMLLIFAGSSEEKVLSVTLGGTNYQLMQGWLSRCGVNDLSTENPLLDWIFEATNADHNRTESRRFSR